MFRSSALARPSIQEELHSIQTSINDCEELLQQKGVKKEEEIRLSLKQSLKLLNALPDRRFEYSGFFQDIKKEDTSYPEKKELARKNIEELGDKIGGLGDSVELQEFAPKHSALQQFGKSNS